MNSRSTFVIVVMSPAVSSDHSFCSLATKSWSAFADSFEFTAQLPWVIPFVAARDRLGVLGRHADARKAETCRGQRACRAARAGVGAGGGQREGYLWAGVRQKSLEI